MAAALCLLAGLVVLPVAQPATAVQPATATFDTATVGEVPGAPTVTNVDTDAFGPVGIVQVWWEAPAPYVGPAIDTYRITLARGGGNAPIVREYGPTDRHAFIELHGLEGIEIEGVGVAAHNSNGWGPGGSWAGGPVSLTRKPDPPRGLFVEVQASDAGQQARVDWRRPTDLSGAYDPPRYDVVIEGPTPSSGEVILGQQDEASQFVTAADLATGWYRVTVRTKGPLNRSRPMSRWFAVGTPCDPTFSDVPGGSAFCTPVSWMVRQGVGSGFPNGTFHPTAPVSRQAMAAFLYKATIPQIGTPTTPICTSAPFPDVPVSHPFCGQIRWLADQGIASGYPDGTFRPADPVSRQAAASMLYKARIDNLGAGAPSPCEADDVSLADVPAGHAFCPYIKQLVDLRVISGYPDGTFRPTAAVTRQAMATFFYRWRP